MAWTEGLNLPSDDAKLAAAIMRHTASQNPRVAAPGLHLILSFDPTDLLDDATQRSIALRYLQELRLTDHQVLMVAHRDRAHRHVHFMVNRVDPATGRAWHLSHDYQMTQKWARAVEREFGFRRVPGRLSRGDELTFAEHETLTIGERRTIERTGDQPLVIRARAALPDLLGADSWLELDRRLAAHGMRIESRGSGLVVTDGEREVKASRVSPALTTRSLEGRFGRERHTQGAEMRAPLLAELAAKISEVEQQRELRAALGNAATDLATYRHEDNRLEAAARQVESAWTAFDRALRDLYADPAVARESFSRRAHTSGLAEAGRVMSEAPQLLGELVRDRVGRAGAQCNRAAALGRDAIRAEHDLWQVAAEIRTERIQHQFGRAMRRVFRDPQNGERAFLALAESRDPATAAENLRETPERLGALRIGGDGDTARTRVAARAAAELGEAVALVRLGPVESAVWASKPPISIQLAERRASRANASFQRALANVFVDPIATRMAFTRSANEQGILIAARAMRERPEAFGNLLSTEQTRLRATSGHIRATVTDVALGQAVGLGIRALRAERERDMLRAGSTRYRANAELDEQLARVYAEPLIVKEVLTRATAARGSTAVADIVRTNPERFGRLRAARDSDPALIHAANLAAETWLRYVSELSQTQDERAILKRDIARTSNETSSSRDATGGGVRTPTREAAEIIQRLTPRQTAELEHLLTLPQRAIVAQIRGHIRAALLGRDMDDRV